jgi:hypothetical protein
MTTIESAAGWNGPALTEIRHDEVGRPVLFTNARILSLDPLIGTIAGDVLLGGSLIVGVGPGIVTAAGDDNAIGVDATGTAYWIDGDRIDYLDDLGFWAFGEFVGTSCTTPAT